MVRGLGHPELLTLATTECEIAHPWSVVGDGSDEDRRREELRAHLTATAS